MSSTKKWTARCFIVGYLCVLSYGLLAHTLKYKNREHVGMYFIVWDMFCGWDAFESRRHLVAEGESGQFYDVSPPWKEFQPYGAGERHDYDTWGYFAGIVGANTLKQTDHEPIVRMYLVEEQWSKKYNLPPQLWERRFDDEQQPRSYFYLRTVFDGHGNATTRHHAWANHLAYRALLNNPRLKEDVARSQPYLDAKKFFGVQRVSHTVSERVQR